MTHEDIKILISAYMDGEITPSEKDIVEEHLSVCPSCQKDYKAYISISSSLSKWPDETLSPDEEIKVQKRFEQRREPMFTKRSATIFATTLALTIIVGSVVNVQIKHGIQGRLRSASDDIRDQYSYFVKDKKVLSEPYYLASNYGVTKRMAGNSRSMEGQLASVGAVSRIRSGMQNIVYEANYPSSNAAVDAVGAPQGAESDYYAINDEERKKIQRAEVNLMVDNAFKTKLVLTDLITQTGGIIMNSEFNRSSDGSGSGTMVCKVYPKDLEHTLQEIRKLGDVQNENESSLDVTDRYGDIEKNITKFTADKDHLQQTLKSTRLFNPTTEEEKNNTKRQIEQVQEAISSLDHMIKSLRQQTEMSIVVVNFYDKNRSVVKENDKANEWKTMFENKWKMTSMASLEVFSNILFGIIFLLSYVVPVLVWGVIFAVIYWIISLFFKK